MDKPYHHGDVRRMALEAGMAVVEERGADALSLRKIAEKIGVTHRALYRHFDNKSDLLEALRCEGFRAFLADLQSVEETAAAFVTAYTSFALRRPHLYGLMMEEVAEKRSAEVIAAQAPVISWMQKSFDSDDEAIRAWMILHGGLSLSGAGVLQRRDPERLRDFLLKLVTA